MGLFVYTKKGSIISTVDLPTTEIIEPKKVPSSRLPLETRKGYFYTLRKSKVDGVDLI